ncbi:hypothetical protein KIN20_028947 [Parelaphostrongylus tenuis]|uniref:Uncharacterized protein n=1 Tax=Parelaphostrongylus tenuis TaxID=148309 RepID=A0AAD5R2B5_PARTN|nr:hypothetical protein KIN20_028947 [Parelaphostrongylus tenuis]
MDETNCRVRFLENSFVFEDDLLHVGRTCLLEKLLGYICIYIRISCNHTCGILQIMIEKDQTEIYDLLIDGLKTCIELASLPQTMNSDFISTSMKNWLVNRKKLRPDLFAAHLLRAHRPKCRPALYTNISRLLLKLQHKNTAFPLTPYHAHQKWGSKGDTVLPELFIAALHGIINALDSENFSIQLSSICHIYLPAHQPARNDWYIGQGQFIKVG